MEPASTIIKRLGGPATVASVAGVHLSRVYYWTYPRENGGAGGVIPQKHIPALLEYAKQSGVALHAGDFFLFPEQMEVLPQVASGQHYVD